MKRYILREWGITLSIAVHHFTFGYVMVLPSVILPAIKKDGAVLHASTDEASWFIASYGFTIALACLILPPLMQIYGRRIINLITNIANLIGSLVMAMSNDIIVLIIGRSIHGINFAGVDLFCIILAEYTHPKRRGFYIVFKMAASPIGMLTCHCLGLTFTWRQLIWISTIPAVIGLLSTLIWKESPAWLAFKGRYQDCAKSFKYMRGDDLDSENELRELIFAQKQSKKSSNDYGTSLKAVRKAFQSKEFLKVMVPVTLLSILFQSSGCNVLFPYIIEIMTKLSGSTVNAYYFTIGFDIGNVISVLLASLVVRYFRRRVVLFTIGSAAYVILAFICIFHYLGVKGVLLYKWLTPSLMIIYQFLNAMGIMPILVVAQGELYPLKYRGLGAALSGVLSGILELVTSKLTSNMLEYFDIHGTFAVFVIASVVILLGLYFLLPETKDKTLQSIELDLFDLKLNVEECDADADEYKKLNARV